MIFLLRALTGENRTILWRLFCIPGEIFSISGKNSPEMNNDNWSFIKRRWHELLDVESIFLVLSKFVPVPTLNSFFLETGWLVLLSPS